MRRHVLVIFLPLLNCVWTWDTHLKIENSTFVSIPLVRIYGNAGFYPVKSVNEIFIWISRAEVVQHISNALSFIFQFRVNHKARWLNSRDYEKLGLKYFGTRNDNRVICYLTLSGITRTGVDKDKKLKISTCRLRCVLDKSFCHFLQTNLCKNPNNPRDLKLF